MTQVAIDTVMRSRTSAQSLDDEVIKFGRNPDQVDVILQSRLYSNMISREHAEIRRVRNIDGTIAYQLVDKSLNGTYVNETRAKEAVLLHPGDVIKFGHVNGAAIVPGQHAPQPHAEFTFTFEKVPRNVGGTAAGPASMAAVTTTQLNTQTQSYSALQSGYNALSQYPANANIPPMSHAHRLSAAYQTAYSAAGYPHVAPAAVGGFFASPHYTAALYAQQAAQAAQYRSQQPAATAQAQHLAAAAQRQFAQQQQQAAALAATLSQSPWATAAAAANTQSQSLGLTNSHNVGGGGDTAGGPGSAFLPAGVTSQAQELLHARLQQQQHAAMGHVPRHAETTIDASVGRQHTLSNDSEPRGDAHSAKPEVAPTISSPSASSATEIKMVEHQRAHGQSGSELEQSSSRGPVITSVECDSSMPTPPPVAQPQPQEEQPDAGAQSSDASGSQLPPQPSAVQDDLDIRALAANVADTARATYNTSPGELFDNSKPEPPVDSDTSLVNPVAKSEQSTGKSRSRKKSKERDRSKEKSQSLNPCSPKRERRKRLTNELGRLLSDLTEGIFMSEVKRTRPPPAKDDAKKHNNHNGQKHVVENEKVPKDTGDSVKVKEKEKESSKGRSATPEKPKEEATPAARARSRSRSAASSSSRSSSSSSSSTVSSSSDDDDKPESSGRRSAKAETSEANNKSPVRSTKSPVRTTEPEPVKSEPPAKETDKDRDKDKDKDTPRSRKNKDRSRSRDSHSSRSRKSSFSSCDSVPTPSSTKRKAATPVSASSAAAAPPIDDKSSPLKKRKALRSPPATSPSPKSAKEKPTAKKDAAANKKGAKPVVKKDTPKSPKKSSKKAVPSLARTLGGVQKRQKSSVTAKKEPQKPQKKNKGSPLAEAAAQPVINIVDNWSFHDPTEKCAALDKCAMPQDEDVDWVQCDDCERWYHFQCTPKPMTRAELDDPGFEYRCGCDDGLDDPPTPKQPKKGKKAGKHTPVTKARPPHKKPASGSKSSQRGRPKGTSKTPAKAKR